MRDYLFDAATGYFLVDMPTGWQWGTAELNIACHTIIRTNTLALPAGEIIGQVLVAPLVLPGGALLAAGTLLCSRVLQLRNFKLAAALNYSGVDNIYSDAVLVMCPCCDCIAPSQYVDVRTGANYGNEEDMWGSVRDGDRIVMLGWGDASSRPIWGLKIVAVASRQAECKQFATMEEAIIWLS